MAELPGVDILDALVAQLLPPDAAATARAVLACGGAGYTGARRRDGHKASWLTPSGVPFEASVTGGGDRLAPGFRFVTETATAMPFLGPRLVAQRAALDELVGWLPQAVQCRGVADDVDAFVTALFPDPAALPARTWFATSVGVVLDPDLPGGIAGLKLYGNVGVDPESLDRLAKRWPEYGDWAAADRSPWLGPSFAAIDIDADGVRPKLYFAGRRADPAMVRAAVAAFGGDADPVLDELARCGVDDSIWARHFVIQVGGEVSFHVSAKTLAADHARMVGLVALLAARHHGTTAGVDALAAAVPGGKGRYTLAIGCGTPDRPSVGKFTVYLAPSS
jgi:hypothetical protein